MQAKSFKEGLIVAIDENMFAVKQCLLYKKDKTWRNYEEGDILGFPAAILLLITIETIGVLVTKKFYHESLLVLNHDIFENQSISKKDAEDIYRAYRNNLVHNSLLLRGLKYSSIGDIFIRNKKNEIISINLKKLNELCERGVERFEKILEDGDIENSLGKVIKRLFRAMDNNKCLPGMDSQILANIQLSGVSVSGTNYISKKSKIKEVLN